MHSLVQVPEVSLQVQPVLVPRHAVDARRGFRPKREIRHPKAIDIDVVQERSELRVLILPRDPSHTCQRTRRALSGAVSGARFAGRVPLGQPPFLHHLRPRRSGLVRRLRR